MNQEFVISDCTQMNKRKFEAARFYTAVFNSDEMPLLVTDDASLSSIYLGDELELIEKIKEEYKIIIDSKHFNIPFWKLIDILEKNLINST